MPTSQFPKSTSSQKRQASFNRVLEAILSPDQDLARIDLGAMSNLSPAQLEQYQAVWQNLSLQRRQDLAAALVELSEDRFDIIFNDIFQWLLLDEDARVRSLAIEGLWEDEDVRQITPLLRLMQADPAPAVRAAAALSLGRFMLLGELEEIDPQAAKRVEDALRQAYVADEYDVAVRRRVLESLAYSGQEDVEEFILEAYESDDHDMQVSAVFAMGRNASRRWRKIVLAELSSADDAIRFEAVRAAGELAMKSAVPDLVAMVSDKDVELRDSAIWALGRIGGQQARRTLRALTKSEDEDVREAAQESLAELELFADLDDLGTLYFQ
ncbi:MAG: HEAT repeat domain-containing protein [Caldilineales bacterium]